MSYISLKGRVAIVLGGSGDIGSQICKNFTYNGASVIMGYMNYSDKIDKVIRKIRDEKGEIIPIQVDIRSSSDVDDIVFKTLNHYGSIDILVNSFGITPNALPVVELEESVWDNVISINLKGAFLSSKAVAKHMIKNKYGRIVNISSIFGKNTPALRGAYGASKHGMIGLTQAMAKELGKYNITVNAVCPGPVQSEMLENIYKKSAIAYGITKEEYREKIVSSIPLGRVAEPEEIADVVSFLSSDMAKYISGSIIDVSGGLT